MTAYLSFPIKATALAKLRTAGITVTVNPNKDRPKGADLAKIIQNYDIIMIGVAQTLTKDMLAKITSPKIIATMSIGLDHIDPAFLLSSHVRIANIKYANATSVAEHIFALTLALSHRLTDPATHRNDLYERTADISGKTIGFIGAGNITREAMRFATAFGMRILCHTRNPREHRDLNADFVTLDELLKQSDIINISLPLNKQTHGVITKQKIALMKPTAIFINTARAELVDINALVARADKTPTFYVGLDIDLDEHKNLFKKPRRNVIVTPHTAGISKEAIDRMDDEIVAEILNLIG